MHTIPSRLAFDGECYWHFNILLRSDAIVLSYTPSSHGSLKLGRPVLARNSKLQTSGGRACTTIFKSLI